MSFGWSFGDIIAGIQVVWNVYQALSDGPLNASLEFCQFFDEFALITHYLGDWQRRAHVEEEEAVARLHQQLRQQCETFIKRHMLLIQEANPRSRATREGRSTWLQKVEFSRTQVVTLFQKVQWPLERKELERLRTKLMMFLEVATHSITVENRELLLEIKQSNVALQEANLKLVSSHLDFVSRITLNLKQVAYPPGHQASQIDSFKLRRFEEALLPPPPLLAIEASPTVDPLLLRVRRQGQLENGERELAPAVRAPTSAPAPAPAQRLEPLNQDERMISERLENLFKRSGVPTTEAGSSSANADVSPVVHQILERLWETRTKIGEAVGLPVGPITQTHILSMIDDPQRALLQELGVWHQFEERVQYEVHRRENLLAQAVTNPVRSSASSLPIAIPARRPSIPSPSHSRMSISPRDSSSDVYGSPDSMFLHNRTSSVSSVSISASIRLDRFIPVFLQYQNQGHTHEIEGEVQYLSRSDDGEVSSITTVSKSGLTEIRHCLDRTTPATAETSMKPFLDNSHVDKVHKFRVSFQGSHILKFTRHDNTAQHKSAPIRCTTPPIYKFWNKKEDPSSLRQSSLNYIKFQELLLGKQIALLADVALIDSASKKDPQCRVGTIRVLVDKIARTRSIFYFRKAKDQQPAFAEWPTTIFKEPKEPSPKCKSISLESRDGKSLSLSGGLLSRQSTQGSVTTIGSMETSSAAFSRIQERSGGKTLKGLIIDFYEPKDCHNFWKEFIVKEIQFDEAGLAIQSGHS